VDGRLSGRIHLGAGLHDVAHDDGFHLVGAKLCARHRGADRRRAEIGRRYLFESAPNVPMAVRTGSAKTTERDVMTNLLA
jgi:hypothetical protein